MNRTVKLVLDIGIGAVIPVLILNTLNEPLGTTTTYVVAALVPVAWVFADLLLITRRFNVITSYIGAAGVMQGLLAFWFVDGIAFAFKDTAGSIFAVAVFGGSIWLGRPMMYYFTAQALAPSSPPQQEALAVLLNEARVRRALLRGTKLVLLASLLIGAANFCLNLQMVVAEFGTPAFNQQVAQVNTITRIALAVPELIGFWLAIVMVRRAIAACLPEDEQDEYDFWELLELREAQRLATD